MRSLVLVFTALPALCAADSRGDLLNEYKERLGVLEEAYANVEMTGRFRDASGNPERTIESDDRVELFGKGEKQLVRVTALNPKGQPSELTTVACRGPEIAFRLHRQDRAYVVD